MIDTIIVATENVFTPEEEQKSFVFRAMNRLRFPTREYVIRQEFLFKKGEPYDSVQIEETERNLRALQLFRSVDIDTTRLGDRLAVVVRAQDGWSTKLRFTVAVAADGTLTGTIGVVESNLLGSGNEARFLYRKGVDRDGFEVGAAFKRLLGSRFDASGLYMGLSDGKLGDWRFGIPFRAYHDRRSLEYDAEAADRRILQFRNDGAVLDTTFFQRQALINRITGAIAAKATTTRYVRLGLKAEIRQEEYFPQEDTLLMIPDTVTGQIGLFVETSRARFKETRHFNGFGQEDLDLSTTVKFFANFAPSAFGYDETGIGPGMVAQAALPWKSGFIKGSLLANGLFNAAELDSGRVVLGVTVGQQPAPRHATVLHIEAGFQEDPPPGGEFDLGFETPPRNWGPHSFVGTRMLWGTLEHRWFVWDEILSLVGLGFAAFVDYGGAWYPGQSARFGGNVGIGLRTGSALSTIPRTGRLDLGLLFGPDVAGDRVTLSFGSGFVF